MTRTMTPTTELTDRILEFHGDLCPGIAMGIQASRLALGELGATADDDLVAIVETNYCAADGVQLMTGCTFGKARLVHRDWGKQAFTLVDRGTGRAVRVTPRTAATGAVHDPTEEEWWALADRMGSGSATPEDQARFRGLMADRAHRLLDTDPRDLFVARDVEAAVPPKPWIQRTVQCDGCGEPVTPGRIRTEGGRSLCIPCAETAG